MPVLTRSTVGAMRTQSPDTAMAFSASLKMLVEP